MLDGKGGTGPPRLEKVRCRCVVNVRRGGSNFGALQGPVGGSHGHAVRFSSAGMCPPSGSSTVSSRAGGAGTATGGGEGGGDASSLLSSSEGPQLRRRRSR